MNMPEYMRVRQYLYNLINKSDGKHLQIPSENDLCRLFNVSRITVRGAIQGLVKDKYLIPQRGIGTFMNPERINSGVKNTISVGMLIGDGRCVTNPFPPVMAEIIIQHGMKFELIFLPDSDSPERLVELIKAGIDAVIWMYPNYSSENGKYIEMLAQSGIPLLVIETDHQVLGDIDYIISEPSIRGTRLAEYLFARGYRNMLFVHNYPLTTLNTILYQRLPHQSYCARMKELTDNDQLETGVTSVLELEEKVQTNPTFINRFDVIYSVVEVVPHTMEILDRNGIVVPDNISYLVYGKSNPYFFHGLRPDYVDDETWLRQAVFEWLELRLRRNCRSGRFERNLTLEIVPGETAQLKPSSGRLNNSVLAGTTV